MIRSAAKNHERVAVVVDPADYAPRARRARRRRRGLGGARASALARKAFAHTAAYDGAIASHLGRIVDAGGAARRLPARRCTSPATLARALRYGENPHQKAAFYARRRRAPARRWRAPRCCRARSSRTTTSSISTPRCASCAEFARAGGGDHQAQQPVRRRRSPTSGVADAYRRARETDPVSAFGGIVAVNRPVDGALARELSRDLPRVRDRARRSRPRRWRCWRPRRTCACSPAEIGRDAPGAVELRSVAGGFLVQTRDRDTAAAADGEGRLQARADRRRAARSRLRLARLQARQVERHRVRRRRAHAGHRRRPDVARRLGADRRLQGARAAGRARWSPPTPSSRSATASTRPPRRASPPSSSRAARCATPRSIAAADEHGMAMVFTGERHFRH